VLRMRDVLQKAIAQRLSTPEIDSPVFLFLPQLARGATTVDGAAAAALPLAAQPAAAAGDSVATILEAVREAKREATRPQNWRTVVALLQRLEKLQPNDPYVVQQLALATYKAQVPDVLSALREARAIVARLNPDNSSDAETIGLAATIHKRLWNQVQDREDLDAAIRLYMRGYVIKNDYYNGINSAFMLDTRASFSQGDESLADRVIARRLRREVIALCDALLVQQADTLTQDDRFWIQATKVEALSALGRLEEAMSVRASLGRAEGWMITSLESQLEAVARLNSLHESSPGASA